MSTSPLRDFLEIPYDELEEMNLEAQSQRLNRVPADKIREQRMKYLADEKRIKAVTVCFTDLEGRLHMLDYDKKFLLEVRRQPHLRRLVDPRLLAQSESDLRLAHRLAGLLLAARPTSSAPARCWCSARCSSATAARTRRHARAAQGLHRELFDKDGTVCHAATRDRGLPLQGPRRRAALPRDRPVRVHLHRRLLPLAARATRCARSSTRAAEAQRAMGFAEREGPPRGGALASSR